MNTLKTTVNGHVSTDDTKGRNCIIQNSEAVSGTWFFVVLMLLLSAGGLYLLWAKVSVAWPFSH